MKTLKGLSIIFFVLTATSLLSGCNVVNVHEPEYEREHRGYGPPPHAPAHGYRHKHRDHTLEYDHDLGVYIVVGFVDHYFDDGLYYKYTKHGWYSSHDLNKDWHEYRGDTPPGKLYKKHGKGHAYGKDKHKDRDHDDREDHGHNHNKNH